MAIRRSTKTYKAMMDELQALLSELQVEDLDVDVAIAKYTKGQQLIVELQEYLKGTERRIFHPKIDKAKADD